MAGKFMFNLCFNLKFALWNWICRSPDRSHLARHSIW